jgi:hypothetical protein
MPVVTVQLGQCGNQVQPSNYPVALCNASTNHNQPALAQLGVCLQDILFQELHSSKHSHSCLNTWFRSSRSKDNQDGRPCARAVLIDMEPKVGTQLPPPSPRLSTLRQLALYSTHLPSIAGVGRDTTSLTCCRASTGDVWKSGEVMSTACSSKPSMYLLCATSQALRAGMYPQQKAPRLPCNIVPQSPTPIFGSSHPALMGASLLNILFCWCWSEHQVIQSAYTAVDASGNGWQYSREQHLVQQSGSGNNWAQGHHVLGPTCRDAALNLIRREVGLLPMHWSLECSVPCLLLLGGDGIATASPPQPPPGCNHSSSIN